MAEAMTSDIVGEDEMPFWCDHLEPVSNALIHLHPELNMKKEKKRKEKKRVQHLEHWSFQLCESQPNVYVFPNCFIC